VVTALATRRRSPIAVAAMSADIAVLVCGGWFDTMTASGGTQLSVAVASAAFVELPLAACALLMARHAVVRIADARALVAGAGVPLP